jgi:hypothetical protein
MSESFMRYLEERLCQWADWYTRGNCYGLGYPRCSVEYRILLEGVIQRNSGAKPLPSNEAAEEIENLVKQMAQYDATMAKALRCHYFVTGNLRLKSSHLKMSHSHFKHYVDMGHQWLAGRLSGHKPPNSSA